MKSRFFVEPANGRGTWVVVQEATEEVGVINQQQPTWPEIRSRPTAEPVIVRLVGIDEDEIKRAMGLKLTQDLEGLSLDHFHAVGYSRALEVPASNGSMLRSTFDRPQPAARHQRARNVNP